MNAEPIQIHSFVRTARTDVTTPASTAITPSPFSGASGCAIGLHDGQELVLDANLIPHAVRHAAIFGALDGLALDVSLDLLVDHMPFPLIAELDERHPDEFETELVEAGPKVWRVRITRVAA